MRILILSQVFWPDTVSTAQHLYDLAEHLAVSHSVRVITSKHNYENPSIRYPLREERNGIDITRLSNTGLGKKNVISRLIDFFSFNLLLCIKLLQVNKKNTDLIIGLTSPPLVSFFGTFWAKRKKIPFYYWTMDLQPELAIASGLIKEKSFAARSFQKMGNYIFKNAEKVIALDKYMAAYAVKRGADLSRVHVVPVWPVIEEFYDGARLNNPFRLKNGFGDRIVVMYSGNHSFIHPLDTLLASALQLKNDPRFLFVFIGGGVRKKDVTNFKHHHNLQSIIQLDYQPRNLIHFSLGSADLQVVILGDNQVGYTHPNKIYGAMLLAKPILYIGPDESHITDILDAQSGNIFVKHAESDKLTNALLNFADKGADEWNKIGVKNREIALNLFHPEFLKSKMADVITNNP